MPARRNLGPKPRHYLGRGEPWPDGYLAPGAPREAEFLKEIATRLRDACGKQKSIRSVANAAGMHPQTIHNILNGDTWCEVPTIYRLEKALQTRLWHTRHIRPSRPKDPEKSGGPRPHRPDDARHGDRMA